MNKCWLTGRLSKKPELRKINENSCVCDFTIATNRPTNRDGERVADFINCIVWNKQAENLCKYQDKGNLIGVSGEIRTDNYEVNGTKKYKTYVLTSNIEFLEKKNDIPLEKLTTKTDFDKTGQIQISEDDYPF
jgi:single-strand DNA-binding protein